MDSLRWRPRLADGDATVNLSIAQRLWDYVSDMVGGGDESGAGVPETFVIRRDRGAALRLRCFESEWPALRGILERSQGGAQSIDFRFDQDDAGTQFEVYVIRPGVDDRIRPDRGRHRGELEISIEIRTADGSPIDLPAFGS